ncbi:ion transporter [Methanospirillum stamsii]|uniref:Ion transporter n=1 Tax=Methanospirillum stamsii TaxID=1277351 RepID=A0A2V2N0Y3_9EURY|nr:ion transporter [Methanospirillum stamsii]PWR73409.1 ion transporter [Methanospirillum stamsii]
MNYQDARAYIHNILDNPSLEDRNAQFLHVILASAILVNTIAVILYTVKSIAFHYGVMLNLIMNTCITIFLIEYILRIWSCTQTTVPYRMITDRIRYAANIYLLIDLVSVLPLFIPVIVPSDLAVIRFSRLISIFKLGRFTRYTSSLTQLKQVIRRKSEIIVIMLFSLVFVILFSSTIMYVVENHVQPDKFSSIPASLWWAVMTVTTVGYGDIIPVTTVGKIIAGVITISGVLVLALPSAIMASGFIEEKERARNNEIVRINMESSLALIDKLGSLHSKGYITDEEYLTLKKQIIFEK